MKDRETKSFSKQIKRYAKVGGVVGKLATAKNCNLLDEISVKF